MRGLSLGLTLGASESVNEIKYLSLKAMSAKAPAPNEASLLMPAPAGSGPALIAWLMERRLHEREALTRKAWRNDLSTPWRRLRAHLDMLFVDHGIFRIFWTALHPITESKQMWRSNQPAPMHIAAMKRRGIKTIVNLRGARSSGTYALEAEACRKAGITLVNFGVGSREAPRPEAIRAAKELFDTIEYPALMHCKSGADRVGFMSVLYLVLHENVPVDKALKHLSWRYGHIRQGKTGILDHFFESYLAYNSGTPTTFKDWADLVYDRDACKTTFMSNWWANILVDRLLRRE
jgi:protein tyrosine phosphatase (PTP) superfamily phosphohydrolase (DUF442 family)